MGKRTKLREAQRRAAEQALAVRLRARNPARSEPAFINSFAEFAPAYRGRIETYRDLALRAPETWRCRLRIRSPERRFIDLVRYIFADYPFPEHLANAWIEGAAGEWPDAAANATVRPDFRLWSIIVGRGGSLYRDAARPFMSKLETHHFVTAPAEINSVQRAFWYAFARAQTDEGGVALRVARSKLVRFPVMTPFWKDVARFFAQNPVQTHEMDDLIDYINAARLEDGTFTLWGRSLKSLRRSMVRWHRLEREVAAGVRWLGYGLPNARYETGIGEERAIWRFTQIKSSAGLVRESQEMEHCVWTYQADCARGLTSIWSLTREYPAGQFDKRLTIEVERHGGIRQSRGYANRLPTAEELEVMQVWTADLRTWAAAAA